MIYLGLRPHERLCRHCLSPITNDDDTNISEIFRFMYSREGHYFELTFKHDDPPLTDKIECEDFLKIMSSN